MERQTGAGAGQILNVGRPLVWKIDRGQTVGSAIDASPRYCFLPVAALDSHLLAFDDRDDVALDGAGVRPDQDFCDVLAGELDDVVRHLFSLLCQISLFRYARP